MWLERISGGGADLIELQDAKDYLRILSDETDGEVEAAISTASAFLDVDEDGFGGLGFPLVAQQWAMKGTSFGAQVLRMPFARIESVDEIRFTGPDGQTGTVAPQNYQLVKCGREWRVVLLSGSSWPQVADRPDAVEVRFTSGWPDVASVPGDIIDAAKVLMAHFFHCRGASAEDGVTDEIMRGVDRLTARYRRFAM